MWGREAGKGVFVRGGCPFVLLLLSKLVSVAGSVSSCC